MIDNTQEEVIELTEELEEADLMPQEVFDALYTELLFD